MWFLLFKHFGLKQWVSPRWRYEIWSIRPCVCGAPTNLSRDLVLGCLAFSRTTLSNT